MRATWRKIGNEVGGGSLSWRVCVFISVAGLIAVLNPMSPSGAIHEDEIFELDGNTEQDDVDGVDWETLFEDGVGGDIVAKVSLPDPDLPGFVDSASNPDYAFPDTTTYTSGSKDTLDVSRWSCTDSNNLGGKFDIINAYSAIYEENGDLLLFFGIERAATEGDGNMGFWFLQDGSVDCEKTGKGKAPAFTGNHVDGDVFVVAGFSNGGTQATITAYRWEGGATGQLGEPFVSGVLCGEEHSTHDDACGIVNTEEIETPWNSPPKNGTNADPLPTNAFYEGFVRVDSEDVEGCFATFVANTRSSTSPTATIHDFSRGSFPRCQAGTDLNLEEYSINGGDFVEDGTSDPEIVVFKGDQVELVFGEENTGNFPLAKPTGLGFVVSDDCVLSEVVIDDNTDPLDGENVGDLNGDGLLDPGEVWLYSCTVDIDDDTGTVTAFGHGIDDVSSDTVRDVTYCAEFDETEETDPNPPLHPATVATCDDDEITVVSFDILAPSTNLTASATLEITFWEENDENAPLTRPGDGDFVRQLAAVCDSFEEILVDDDTDPLDGKNIGDTGTPTGVDEIVEGTDGNGVLDPGEKWAWLCVIEIDETDDDLTSVTAIGHGITGGFDVTACDEGDAENEIAPAALQLVKLGDNETDAEPICDPDEVLTVTLSIDRTVPADED